MLFLDKKTWQSIVELLSRVDLFDAIQGVGQVTFGKVGVEAHYTVKLKWSDKK